MARGRFVGRAVRAPRRKTTWAGSANVVGVTNIPAATKVLQQRLTSSQLFAAGPVSTIVRTRGIMSVKMPAGVQTDVEVHGAAGIGVVSAQAFAAGAAAIPFPFENAEWDGWLWHQYFAISSEASSGAPAAVWLTPREYEIDSKAMRKLRDDKNVVVTMVENESAQAVDVGIWFRQLLKLT